MFGYNDRSVPKNKTSLKAVLHSYQYDIVFVNETWLTPSKAFQLENRQYRYLDTKYENWSTLEYSKPPLLFYLNAPQGKSFTWETRDKSSFTVFSFKKIPIIFSAIKYDYTERFARSEFHSVGHSNKIILGILVQMKS